MIESVVLLFVDILLPFIIGTLELAALVLFASIRPWRYLIFRSFRESTNAELAQSPVWVKWWYLFWGTIALVGSAVIVLGIVLLFRADGHVG